MAKLRDVRLAWLLAAAGLAACQEAAAPVGTQGSVTVRAYIDRDATGTFTAGDSSLADVAVTLTAGIGGAQVGTASTGADGFATFDALDPGSYVVQPSATVNGAVMTSAPTPSAVIGFHGGADTVDVRYAFFPGTVSGRIYRDDNANGSYDQGVDTPGAGLYVLLKSGTTTIDSVVADDDGAYTFARVAPGDFTLVFEQPTTIDFGAATDTRTISVGPETTTTTDAVFTGSLVIPISTARARAAGSPVTVNGKLTVAPGTFTSGSGGVNSEIWVQDNTGGISVFSIPSSTALVLGDSVEVRGTMGAFSGQEQITSPVVTKIATRSPVAPTTLTVAEANALGANEGLLVAVSGIEITSVPSGTGTAYTVLGKSASGEAIQIRVATGTGITRSAFTVGSVYTVAGVLTENGGNPQIKPRATSDVLPDNSIAAARLRASGTTVTVVGNVIVPPNVFTSGSGGVNSEIWVQDATSGIAVFSVPSSSTLVLGDEVQVTGTLGAFSGQKQITTPDLTVTFNAAGTAPAAKSVTGAQFNALTDEGTLVTLPITITSVPSGTGAAFTVIGTAADGQTVQIRVNGANTGLTRSSFTVATTYTVTGVLTQFNGTAQVKPRFASDVTP